MRRRKRESLLRRKEKFFERHFGEFSGNIEELDMLVTNFVLTCDSPTLEDALNFCLDIKPYEENDRELLQRCFEETYRFYRFKECIDRRFYCKGLSPYLANRVGLWCHMGGVGYSGKSYDS